MKALLCMLPLLLVANPNEAIDVSLCDMYLLDTVYYAQTAMEHKHENRDISVYNVISVTKLSAEQYLKCVDEKLSTHLKNKRSSNARKR